MTYFNTSNHFTLSLILGKRDCIISSLNEMEIENNIEIGARRFNFCKSQASEVAVPTVLKIMVARTSILYYKILHNKLKDTLKCNI